MTRIVAGAVGGRRLKVPPSGTRPTSERVREALFNALQARVGLEGARVLDLYAGSGALGLEALSRGATEVVLVESDSKAAAVVAENIATLGLRGARVQRATVLSAVAATPASPFDIVVADPPYAIDDDEVHSVLKALFAHGWVGEGSVIVVERATRAPATRWDDASASAPLAVEPEKPRRYGDTRLDIATCYRREP